VAHTIVSLLRCAIGVPKTRNAANPPGHGGHSDPIESTGYDWSLPDGTSVSWFESRWGRQFFFKPLATLAFPPAAPQRQPWPVPCCASARARVPQASPSAGGVPPPGRKRGSRQQPLALAALKARGIGSEPRTGPAFVRKTAGVSGSSTGSRCSGCNRTGKAGTSRAPAQAEGKIGFRGGLKGGMRRGVGGGLRRSRWPGSARAFQPEPSLSAQGTA